MNESKITTNIRSDESRKGKSEEWMEVFHH